MGNIAEDTKRITSRQMSMRKHRTWTRIEDVQEEIDEHLKSLGKKETISVAKIVELNNKNRVSTFVRHCVVAIYENLRMKENRTRSFIGAHNIAYAMLQRHGYVKSEGFGLTGRGSVRNKIHEKEPGYGSVRSSKYGSLYNSVFKRKSSYTNPTKYVHEKHPKIKDVTSGKGKARFIHKEE